MSNQLHIYKGIQNLLTLKGAAGKDGRHIKEEDLSIVQKASFVTDGQHVLWVGEEKKLKSGLQDLKSQNKISKKTKVKEFNLRAQTVMPAFVEAHTHLIHAGDRRHEFELRNQGVSYQEIAAQGGGITNTVEATRKESATLLLESARERVLKFKNQGVTTIEIKTGYGLNFDSEIKLLKIAKKLRSDARIITTYLGAHAIPKDKTRAEYMTEICEKALPFVQKLKLADRVDMFIEKGYFDLADAEKYYTAAKSMNFSLAGHVDQMNPGGSAVWLAKKGADSVDHCVHLTLQEIETLAKTQATCVLLPTSDFYLKIKYPEARKMLSAGVRVALATDYNPGTSPTQDLSFVGVLARLEMKMTLPEVLVAYTFNAAKSLGFNKDGKTDTLGALIPGSLADFTVSDGEYNDFFYQVGTHPIRSVYSSHTK